MVDKDKVVFRDILQKTEYYSREPTKGRISGRDKYLKKNLDDDSKKICNLVTKLKGRGLEKFMIPSNIFIMG